MLKMYRVGKIGSGFLVIMAHPAYEDDEPDPFDVFTEQGIRLVVSLLEPGEARDLGLDNEREIVKSRGMDFIHFPIPDMGQPASAEAFAKLTNLLCQQIGAGIDTLVHCRAGIGRSGLVGAGILMQSGFGLDQALQQISTYRGVRVPETPEQKYWLAKQFAPLLQSPQNKGSAGEQA